MRYDRVIYFALAFLGAALFVTVGETSSQDLVGLCLLGAALIVADDIELLQRTPLGIASFVLVNALAIAVTLKQTISLDGYVGAAAIPISIIYGLIIRAAFSRLPMRRIPDE